MNRRNKGFTLVELQVASTIVLITLLAVLALYLFSWRSFTIGNTVLDVYSNSRNASGWLTRDIRCAAQVESSYTSGGTTYTTSDHVIVLKVPSIDKSNPPESLSAYSDRIIYQLEGGDLKRIVIIDQKFKNTGDLYYNQSGRSDKNSVITGYCSSLTFSSFYEPTGKWENLSFYDGSTSERMLSTINTVSIYLPINKSTISLSGAGTVNESINPTTVVRLRNK